MTTHFVVHEPGDSVGVVVVEGVKKSDVLTGWVMDGDTTVECATLNDIPIGHKIALQDLEPNDTVIKYGTDIGKVVKPIKRGEHLHVHNVKTKRW
ncbi:MAG: UxaA family hydrolase [Desulfovibrio sp.]|uniref:UxaA family hydrolase n=1 Tax=Desulfovibrio sp. TaxID=885 RepID=UPI0025B9F96C|nr:UxaA family hydrolase [Desulfovibrio sp.]MBS6829999.1 UxaA family hydrolase [Desulfovibrio sp.]